MSNVSKEFNAALILWLVSCMVLLVMLTIGMIFTAHVHARTVSPHACWSEVNEQMPGGFERICGPVNKAPVNSRNFSDVP